MTNNTRTDGKELPWIDWIKVICIVLVYLHHSIDYSFSHLPFLQSLYSPFFVNIFFFMSGYLLFKKQLSDKLITTPASEYITNEGGGKSLILNVLNRIIFPTILFSIIIFFPKKMIRADEITTLAFLKETFLGGSMWFTCALAIAELLVLAMLLSRKRNLTFYLLISVILTIIAIILREKTVLDSVSIPWFYKSGMVATLFLSLGGIYQQYEKYIDQVFGKTYFAIILGIVYLIAVIAIPEHIEIDLQGINISITGLLVTLIAIWAIIIVSKKLPKNKFITYYGRKTLGLYLLSGGIPNTIAVIFSKIGLESIYLNVACITTLSFVIGMIAVWFLYKYFPFIFNFRLLTDKGNK